MTIISLAGSSGQDASASGRLHSLLKGGMMIEAFNALVLSTLKISYLARESPN
jgi:hypothetical protein